MKDGRDLLAALKRSWQKLRAKLAPIKSRVAREHAKLFLRSIHSRRKLSELKSNHGDWVSIALGVVIVASGFLAAPGLQSLMGHYFCDANNLSALKSLLGGVGSALIGAAAIAFSMVLFAMQVNVERMPHGLFKQLSADRPLLGAFIGSFILALSAALTSLIPSAAFASVAIVFTLYATAAILGLFLFAYRRALRLINPTEQLSIMTASAKRSLTEWGRRADKAVVVMDEAAENESESDSILRRNGTRGAFFSVNPFWNQDAKQAIQYAISYAKRFAENGDHEVAEAAFASIVRINAVYCTVKRGTFIGSNPFFDPPESTDGFINETLEQLRQTMRLALSNADETLAEGSLRALTALYDVYLRIEYPGRAGRTKTHANIAAGYLYAAVEAVIPHNMPDVMMEGIRLMGRASRKALGVVGPNEIIPLTEKIALYSSVGITRTDHRPVTLTAFEQLADITLDVLIKGQHDSSYALEKLRSDTTEAAKRFLMVPEASLLASSHSHNLAPFYSGAAANSFRVKLEELVHQLIEVEEDHEQARRIIRNISAWSHQQYVPHKELLLLSIEKRSHFAFDTIHWATEVSGMLVRLSTAPACPAHVKPELIRDASWLVSTLSWIPQDIETVSFVENYRIVEVLYEAAMVGTTAGATEFYEACKNLLTAWGAKAGPHNTGWGTLETVISALAALALNEGRPAATLELKANIGAISQGQSALPQDIRERAAAGLRELADEHRHDGYATSRLEAGLARCNQDDLRELLFELAQILEQ